MTEVFYLNHSSVLVSHNGSFCLTDPWYARPSFGSWLPTPPLAIHPAYLIALAQTQGDKFVLCVSHGHDDHCDDEYLAMFPKTTPVVIPVYESKGVVSRLKRIGFTDIRETPRPTAGIAQTTIGDFRFASFINPAISLDDAIVSIQTPDALVVHANDNWQELPADTRETLTGFRTSVGAERSLYMSQCNIADGFPLCYANLSTDEKAGAATQRVKRMVNQSYDNARSVGCRFFLHYAGHATAFIDGDSFIRAKTGLRSADELRAHLTLDAQTQYLDLLPGDRFDFATVHRLFGSVRVPEATLKASSEQFYQSYGATAACDSWRYREPLLTATGRRELVEYFMRSMGAFIADRYEKKNRFRADIAKATIGFAVEGEHEACLLSADGQIAWVATSSPKIAQADTVFSYRAALADRILNGEINWENAYIGYQVSARTPSAEFYNGHVIRWISMFGYFYQNVLSKKRPGLAQSA